MGAAEVLRGRAGTPSSQEALCVADEREEGSVWGYRTAHPRFLDSQSVFTARGLANPWLNSLSARTHSSCLVDSLWSTLKAPFFPLATGVLRVPLTS